MPSQSPADSNPDASPPQPLVEGEDYYWDRGMMVLTELYHRKRGKCCQNGCRHCPWDFKKPKRT